MSRRAALAASVLVLLAASGCARLPPLIASRDALTPEEHLRLGASYEAQGSRPEARAQYQAAVRQAPSCVDCRLTLGNMDFADGRFRAAEKGYRKVLKESPHHPGAANNLAMTILARGGSPLEAETLVLDALSRDGPLRPYALDTLARVYARQGRYADAETAVDLALAAAAPDALLLREQLGATRARVQTAAAEARR